MFGRDLHASTEWQEQRSYTNHGTTARGRHLQRCVELTLAGCDAAGTRGHASRLVSSSLYMMCSSCRRRVLAEGMPQHLFAGCSLEPCAEKGCRQKLKQMVAVASPNTATSTVTAIMTFRCASTPQQARWTSYTKRHRDLLLRVQL